MSRQWYDHHAINKIEDEETRTLYRSIAADKKPYFMRYIYPTLSGDYTTYIRSTERNALREFGKTVSELKSMSYSELTPRQTEFLHYYDRLMPVGVGNCVMNKICWKFENEFDGFVKNTSVKCDGFDPEILKSGVEYSQKEYRAVKSVHEDYVNRLSSYKQRSSVERDADDAAAQLERIKQEFDEECNKVCPNKEILADILIDLCYETNSTKKYVWSACGEQIIKNLLVKHNGIIKYPEICEDGDEDFTYGGNKFKIKEKNLFELEIS